MNRGLNDRDFDALSNFAIPVIYCTVFLPFKEMTLNQWPETSDRSDDKIHKVIRWHLHFPQRTKKNAEKAQSIINNPLISSVTSSLSTSPLCILSASSAVVQGAKREHRAALVHQAPLVPSIAHKTLHVVTFFVIVSLPSEIIIYISTLTL